MAIDLFLESIKSPKTRKGYSEALRRFCSWSGIKESKLKTTPAKRIQSKLIEYVVTLKNQGKSYSLQNVAISSVRKFCDAYDIEINYSKVYNYIGEQTTNREDRPYTKEEIAKMLSVCDARTKALVLLLASTGVRIGAIPGLLIRDLTRIENNGIYKVVVYASSKNDLYYTFTTPEATQAIDAYLEQRRVAGEIIKPDAPLFRQTFPKSEANSPQKFTFDGICGLTQRVMVKSGVRKLGDRTARQKTAINHGMRKFANTQFVKAGIKPVVVELLLGHKIGLQTNYLRLEESDVLAEYQKAIPLLTISDAPELQRKVKELEVQISDIDTMKSAYLKIQADNEQLKSELESKSNLSEERYSELEKMEAMIISLAKEVRDLKAQKGQS